MEAPDENTSPHRALTDRLFALNDRIRADLRAVLGETADLTDAQVAALWRLSGAEAMTARELAERLQCDASTATSMVDRLERRGLVQRAPHPTDRRAKILRLTSDGCRLRERLLRYTAEQSPLARLAPDDRDSLGALLDRALQAPAADTAAGTARDGR